MFDCRATRLGEINIVKETSGVVIASRSTSRSQKPASRQKTSASVELEKVPPSRERQAHLEKLGYVTIAGEDNRFVRKSGRDLKKGVKIVTASRHGYNSRSNSATFKRLDDVRNKVDSIIETQVVAVTSKDACAPVDSPTKFNLDPSIYQRYQQARNLEFLYKQQSTQSGKSTRSNASSSKSVTIVLPQVRSDVIKVVEKTPEVTEKREKNATELPPVTRRSVTFDPGDEMTSSAGRKRSRRSSRRVTPLRTSGEEPLQFIVDDSKSLTPKKKTHPPLSPLTPKKSSAGSRKVTSPMKQVVRHQLTPLSTSQRDGGSRISKVKSRSSSRFSETLKHFEEKLERASPHQPIPTTRSRDIISPPSLIGSDDEYNDDFENI